ncbi:PAS domain-containing sensor histidine kinase [Adhaeribacter soli]|uniref:histidine kinase n=1 Tax=Adhaeribacter soli TaxID=2607655 RepID=A0A5N1J4V7_9BACT|nr:PAS domain-containing sensor histidine kinase [Adhaeribacter soli]KAA9345946.1 PAS domain S-box protein [Adhaeribacter soli]
MPDATFKYERFFELSPDLLCIAGFDGYFKKINAAVPKLLGYSLDELYARPINDFVHPEDQWHTSEVRQELTKAKPLNNFENRYVTKAGAIVWLSWTSQPIESDQLIFAIAKNITHKKRQEAERNALLADLTRINKELKQFNYTTSHDLRSPVNNLLSIFSLLDISNVKDAKTAKFLEVLKMSGHQLKQSMDNYLDLLREKNKLHAQVEEISLEENLQVVLQSIGSLVQTAKATIRINFSEVKTVRFNKVYLQSIFLNLITNAIKYAQPAKFPDISIYSEKQNGLKKLIVADNGQGFDLEKTGDRIFGLHQKFHEHADSKGIGLYLVHSHVTALGGQVSVESKPNEGATFTIKFAPEF